MSPERYSLLEAKDSKGTIDTQELSANQPARETIGRLIKQSRYRRSTIESPNTAIEIEGKKFTIERIEDGDSPDVPKVLELFYVGFDAAEVETEESFKNSIEGRTEFGTPVTPYIIFAVKDEEGKIISAFGGTLLDFEGSDNQSEKECALQVWYIVSDKTIRQNGIARELYISGLMQAVQEADAQNKKLTFAIGECASTAEVFWNKVGWKRIYLEKGNKRTYEELRYIQPPMRWNTETGEIAEDTHEVAQHFMIDSMGPSTHTKQNFLQSSLAFMEGYAWP